MTSLSTLEGQRQHYAGVKDRLWNSATPPEKPRRIIHVHRSGQRDVLPVAKKKEVGVPAGPRIRDFIRVDGDVVHPLPGPAAWRAIVTDVCLKHGLTYIELCSARRKREIVAARMEAAYRLSKETTLSTTQIGRKLGGRDHTTIIHAIRRYDAALRGEVYRMPGRGKTQEAARK